MTPRTSSESWISHITCLSPQPPTPHFFAVVALNCALDKDEDLLRNSYNYMKQQEKCGNCVFPQVLSDPFKLKWLAGYAPCRR